MAFLAPIIASAAVALGATAGVASVIGAIGAAAIGIGLSLGLNALLGPKKPKTAVQQGVQTTLQVGTDVPRQVVFGRMATKGHLAFVHTSGVVNTTLDMVFILSEGRCHGLVDVWVSGERKGLTSVSTVGDEVARYTIDGYNGTAVVCWYDGREGQAADAGLVSRTGGRITTDDVFAGMAYVVVTLTYDASLYQSGIPDFTWEIDGYRCYDWRLDTTAGGSGAHRWADPATWAFTSNPSVILYNYLRGIQAGGETVLGPEFPASALITDYFTAAANACDQDISLAAGGTEDRYRCATVIYGDDTDHRTKLEPIIEAMAGYLVESAGSFGVLAGVAQSSVVTITDDSIVLGREITFQGKLPRDQRVNTVFGQFVDPEIGYQANSYPYQLDSTALTADGEPLRIGYDLEAITSVTQAERAARIRLRETRYQATASITLGMDHIYLDPGDWITWNSAKFGNKTYRILNRVINEDDTITLSLREVNSAIYSWSTSDEGLPIDAPTYQAPPALPTVPTNFAIVAELATAANSGETRPVLKVTYDAITDPIVDALIIEVRRVGQVVAQRYRDDSVSDGTYIVEGVLAGEDYEARGQLVTSRAGASGVWTSWVQTTTSSSVVLPPAVIDFDAFVPDVANTITTSRDRIEDLRKLFDPRPEIRALALPLQHNPAFDIIDYLGETTARLERDLALLRGALSSEMIIIDGAGRIVIGRHAEFDDRINTVSIGLDAANAAINLRATTTYVDTQIQDVRATFEPAESWDFEESVQSWAANGNGTIAFATSSQVDVTATTAPVTITSPAITVTADDYERVKIVLRRTTGTGWGWKLEWQTVAGGSTWYGPVSFTEPVDPTIDNVVQVDLTSNADWTGTIAAIRLQAGSVNGDVFRLDRVQIGAASLEDLLLDDLQTRVQEAEIEIDALQAEITLKATAAALSQTQADLDTAELAISALDASVSAKAEQTSLTALEGRVDTAELDISAAQTAITQRVISRRVENVEAGLDNVAEALATTQTAVSDLYTLARRETSVVYRQSKIEYEAADSIIASDVTQIQTRLDDPATGLEVTADAVDALETRVTTAEGNISSTSSSVTTLQSTINLRARVFRQSTTPTASNVGDIWFKTDDNNRPRVWDGSEWQITDDGRIATLLTDTSANATAISGLDTRVTSAEGTITSQGSSITSLSNEITTARGGQANLDTRLDGIDTTVASKAAASALTALESRVTDAEGDITAQAGAITAVETTVDDLSASGKILISSVTTPAGATAAVEIAARTNDATTVTEAALRLISITDTGGVKSQVQVKANGFFVLDENDDPVTIVDAATGKLIASELLVTGGLSSISANAGTITAGKVQASNGKMIIDLDLGRMTITD